MDVFLSDHAVARYAERVRPSLGAVEAEAELMSVMRHASVQPEPPPWTTPGVEDVAETESWALLGDGIAFPLKRGRDGELCAITCLTRAEHSAEFRAQRNEWKRRRRSRRRNVAAGEAERNRRWGELRAV